MGLVVDGSWACLELKVVKLGGIERWASFMKSITGRFGFHGRKICEKVLAYEFDG